MKTIIHELSEAEQEKIVQLSEQLTERELAALMEKPRPDGGYDLKVSRSTLNKFLNLKKADRVREEAEEMLTRAREAMQLQGKYGPELEAGAKALLKQRFFEEAASARSTKEISSMYRTIRELELKEQRMQITWNAQAAARERWEFSAAKAALENASALFQMLQDRRYNDQQKIAWARETMFRAKQAAGGK